MVSEAATDGAAVVDTVATDTPAMVAQAPPVQLGGISRFYAWADGLPWHGWWLYPVLLGLLLLWGHAVLWATGRLPVGTLDATLTIGAVYGPYTLAVIAYVNVVGGRALDAFWPATGWPEEDRASWRQAFSTVRGGLGVPSLAIGTFVAFGAVFSAPETITGSDFQSRLTYGLALAPAVIFGYSMAILAFVHVYRQLRLVSRIHREAHAIDPFDHRPIYAFSWFTAQIGLAFLISTYYTLTVNSSFQAGNYIGQTVLVFVIAVGAACFILPLWGIHGRLVVEKEALFTGVEIRVQKLAQELYRRIDAGEYDGTKVINESIAAAGAVRERIAKVPTWPWPPQLFRGFLTALLLPIVVYLLSRIIGGQIGA